MKYNIGDRVLFTFLGEKIRGEITEKVDRVKFKIRADDGTVYPWIYGKEPVKVKGKRLEKALGVIVGLLT